MKCPKCQANMESNSYGGSPVQRCTNCHGLWFGSNEFAKLIKDDWLAGFIDNNRTKESIKQDKLAEVHCPECNARMKHLTDEKQPHILYEECTNGCGVYFDAGEFKDLAKTTFWDKFKTHKILDK